MLSGGHTSGSVGPLLTGEPFRATFTAVCGDFDNNTFQATQEGFGDFLSLPRNQSLLNDMAFERTPAGLSDLYRRFLIDGGNCPSNSYSTRVTNDAMPLIVGSDIARRYDRWSDILRRITLSTSFVLSAVQAAPLRSNEATIHARRLEILLDAAKRIGDAYDERIAENRSPSLEDLIIFVQSSNVTEAKEDVKKIIGLLSSDETLTFEAEEKIALHALRISSAMEKANDPFRFAEEMIELAPFLKRTGVDLRVGDLRRPPHIKPIKPDDLRDVISHSLIFAASYGSKKNPVRILLAWNDKTGEIVLNFKDLWITSENDWMKLMFDLEGLTHGWKHKQTSITGHTVFIPVELLEKPEFDSGPKGGSGSSAPPAAGGPPGGVMVEGLAASEEVGATLPIFFEYSSSDGPASYVFDVYGAGIVIGQRPAYPLFVNARPAYITSSLLAAGYR